MDEYRRYEIKVSDYKGKKKFYVTSNYTDKSDYAFYGQDKKLTSYSEYAVAFVARSIKGVEDILENAKPGHTYNIITNGVHGETLRYEDTAVRKTEKPSLLAKLEANEQKSKQQFKSGTDTPNPKKKEVDNDGL